MTSISCIKANTTEAELNTLKKQGIYETELADIAIIAVARAIHKDILVFNTDAEQSISPEEYEGGTRNNLNPIILAYDGSH